MTNYKKGRQNQTLAWEPVPLKFKVGSYLAGNELPNSVSAKFRGVSLCPLYSNKQLRKIHRIGKEKANNANRKSNGDTVKTPIINKIRTTKQTNFEEAIL